MNETSTTGTRSWKSPLVVGLLCAIVLLQLGILFQRQVHSHSATLPPARNATPSRWLSKLIPWRHTAPVETAVTPETVWDDAAHIARMHSRINHLFEQAFHDSFRPPLAPAVVPSPSASNGSAPPDPATLMRDMRREIDGMFMEAMQDLHGHPLGFDEGWANLSLTPGITIKDSGDAYDITVPLPSVDKSDIHLGMEGSILTLIVGRQQSSTNTARTHSQRISRYEQRLRLPGADSDPDHIKATFENGILRIRIPRQEESVRKTGAIKVI